MAKFMIRCMLVVALGLLAFGTWVNDVAAADAMFIFAAFSIGGVWAKHSSAAPQAA